MESQEQAQEPLRPPAPEYEGLEPIPPILGRGLIYLIIALCSCLLGWAYWSKVEVVVTAEGSIIPLGQAAKVQAARGGVVSEILVAEGQSVRRGEALIRMEALEQGSQLLKARTEYENTKSLLSLLEAELATYEDLSKSGVISRLEFIAKKKEHETTTRKLEQLRSEIEVARAGEAQMTVTSPATGILALLKVVNPNQVISPSEVLATVIPADTPLVMELKVLNKDISKIKTGYSCKHKLEAFPFQDYGALKGRITRISPDAEQDPLLGRYYRVIADFSRPFYEGPWGRRAIRPGLSGKTEIVTEKRRLLLFFLDPFRKLRGLTMPS